jgi:hypothetical protein
VDVSDSYDRFGRLSPEVVGYPHIYPLFPTSSSMILHIQKRSKYAKTLVDIRVLSQEVTSYAHGFGK